MNAVIAGRAGLAVLLDGDTILRMDVETPGARTPVRPEELPLLLDRESDLVFLEDVEAGRVEAELDYRWRCQETLDLLLLSLDQALSRPVRREAIQELRESLRADDTRRYVEDVLSTRPLPASADVDGARSIAAAISPELGSFYEVLPSVHGSAGNGGEAFRALHEVHNAAAPRRSRAQTGGETRHMSKSDFIDIVAEKAELTRAAAARVVDAIFDTASGAISEAIHAAGSLSLPGFGKFSKRTRAARTGRNPRTGASIEIPEATTIGFTAGRGLKEQRSTSRRTPSAARAGIRRSGSSAHAGSSSRTGAGSSGRSGSSSRSSTGSARNSSSSASSGASSRSLSARSSSSGSKSSASRSGGSATGASKSGGSKSVGSKSVGSQSGASKTSGSRRSGASKSGSSKRSGGSKAA